MRRLLSSAALALILATPAASNADRVSGTRSALLLERKHTAALTLFRTHAELTVERTVHNGGPRHDQALFELNLPPGAVATGLRTLGALHGRPHWFSGELLEAEAAAEKYRELTGIGGYYPKDPALLSWRDQQLLFLQVFPCPPGQDKSVEYTLKLPLRYASGQYHVTLPRLGTAALPATLSVRAADPRDKVAVSGQGPIDVALTPHTLPLLGGELVALPFAPDRVLTRYAVQAAPRLSRIPARSRHVVVIDASLSTDGTFIERAKLALDGYLSHFAGTDARVEILTFNREVERVTAGFSSLASARLQLGALQVPRRNGSNVDKALSRASRLLQAVPAGVDRRIVLLTDGLSRTDLSGDRLRAALAGSGAVAHLGLLGKGGGRLERDDEHRWATSLHSNGGLVWGAALADRATPAAAAALFEAWARPLRIDRLAIYSPELALQPNLETLPHSLGEGEAIAQLNIESAAAPSLELEGELWTTPVRATISADPGQDALWAALAFGSEVLGELSEEEMMTLALRGGAVSPVTSYLAIEPGVRPSTEGLDHGSHRVGAPRVRMGATMVSDGYTVMDREAFLQERLAIEWRRCGGRPGTASVDFQATRAEIVAVDRVSIAEDGTPLLEQCLTNAVWDLILPAAFYEESRDWTVEV